MGILLASSICALADQETLDRGRADGCHLIEFGPGDPAKHAPRRRRPNRAVRRDVRRNLECANYTRISGAGNVVTGVTKFPDSDTVM
jgi:hypothetical protein